MRNIFPACFVALSLASPASAGLITFDNIRHANGFSEDAIPTGWAGFDWSSRFWWTDSQTAPDTGYQFGIVSAPNVVFNAAGAKVSFRRKTLFELDSFYLTAAWRNGLEVEVTGFRHNVEVDSTTFIVNASGPTLETLDWEVNKVTFRSFGGTSAGYDGGIDGNQFVLDNLMLSPVAKQSISFASLSSPRVASEVPEPSTWAMMLVGFAGLGFAGHRASRKTAAAG